MHPAPALGEAQRCWLRPQLLDVQYDGALYISVAESTFNYWTSNTMKKHISGSDFLRDANLILKIVEVMTERSVEQFMLQPNASLGGRTPIEALALGMYLEVHEVAVSFIEEITGH